MKLPFFLPFAAIPLFITSPSHAAEAFSVHVDGIAPNSPIPAMNAVCIPSSQGKSAPTGRNQRPTIAWNHAPQGTKSFAIIVTDPDVPADFSKANKENTVIDEAALRKDFYHWAVTDIPANVARIPGNAPVGVGKPATNDLEGYVKDIKDYGGPCPPWNDARLHHYHFAIYALDVESLGLSDGIAAKAVAQKLKNNSHILAQSEVVGTYTLNPQLR